MADFAPSAGPPPRVAEGWKAVFNDRYKEWYQHSAQLPFPRLTMLRFYVNTYTKQSQWDKPTVPARDNNSDGALPRYANPGGITPSDNKKTSFDSNNPYNQVGRTESDVQLAARLQAEEDAQAYSLSAGAERGKSDTYDGVGIAQPDAGQASYGISHGVSYGGDQGQLPLRPDQSTGSRGLLAKLLGKGKGKGKSQQEQQQLEQQQQTYPQQQSYGQPQAYGGGGGYAQQQPPRKPGGIGGLRAGALGLGGGLIGGARLENAFEWGTGGNPHDGDDAGGADF